MTTWRARRSERAESSMGGAYGRFIRVSADRHQSIRSYEVVQHLPGERNVAIVDLSFRSVADLRLAWHAIHDVPDRLAGSDDVVFVWPTVATPETVDRHRAGVREFLTEAADRRSSLGSPSTISVVLHQIGLEPILEQAGTVPDRFLETIRSVQIHSLIQEGGAEIIPANHHFRLPSGSHSRGFIRLANVFRSPRDIWTTAAWLAPRLQPNVGIVLDTTTLAPIAAQLEAFADTADLELGPTVVLDRYPRSRLEVSRAVESAADRGRALACLSVDSSGTTRTHFEDALATYAPDGWTLDIIVEARSGARMIPPTAGDHRAVWIELESQPMSQDVAHCAHCAHPSFAHVVRIDERTFLPLAEPSPAIYMPSTDQAANNAFWELADACGAIELEALPAGENEARAERTPLGVKIDFEKLTSDEARLQIAIERRLADLHRTIGKSPAQSTHDDYVSQVLTLGRGSTVVLCAEPRGQSWESHDQAVRSSLGSLGIPTARVHYSGHSLANDRDKSPADSVLCFSLGSVTGSSLKALRIQATDAYPGAEPAITGLCLHARPPSGTEWAAIRNAFLPGRLTALWLAYLPWASPLREELELLDRSGLSGAAVSNRLAYLRSTLHPIEVGEYRETALWGSNEWFHGQRHVRERSLYGYELTTDAAYAAVGSAIHTRRLEHSRKESAQRFMVDLPKVARSYFDALLMSSVVRWTKPGEAWWGEGPSEEAETMRSFLRFGGSTPDEMVVLYPELIIAAALGKVPSAGVEELKAAIQSVRINYPPEAVDAGPHRRIRFEMIDELLHLLE